MIEKMIYLPILLLIISNVFFATKYFKRKRRKRIMRVYGERASKIKEPYNLDNATSKSNYHKAKKNIKGILEKNKLELV